MGSQGPQPMYATTSMVPGMGNIPSATAHGAAPQPGQPIIPTGDVSSSGGYRSVQKANRRDNMNARISGLGFNPGMAPEPRYDTKGPEALDRLRPEVTNF